MAIITITKQTNLDATLNVDNLHGVTFTNEAGAHKFVVSCTRGGAAVTLSGLVTARFMRSNNTTVLLNGAIENGKATVTLHQDCYNVPGRFALSIFVTESGTTTCVYSGVGNVSRTQNGNLIDSGDVVPSIEEIVTAMGNVDAATTRANQAAASAENMTGLVAPTYDATKTYAVGQYVVYNGALYRCKTAIETAEAWTASHWFATPLGNDVSNLGAELDDSILKTDNVVFNGDDSFSPTSWMAGLINDFSGVFVPTGKFRASTQKIRIYGDRIILSGVPNNVKICCYFYDENGQYKSETQWIDNSIAATAGWPYVRISARYDPEDQSAVMNISDLSGIKIQNYAYVLKQITDIKANATESENYVENQLSVMNSKNVFRKVKTQTSNNITYTSEGNGYITLNGSHTADVYFDISELNDLAVEPGKDYWLNYGSESIAKSYIAIYMNTGGGLSLRYNNLVGMNKIHIPTGTVAMLVRLYAKANVVFDNTIYKLTISEAKSNIDLETKSAEIRFLGCFGTGDCTIIKFNDGTVLVIDFGLNEIQETLYRNWVRATTELNITHIDYAIISHYHSDHVGMLLRGIDDMIDESTTFFLPQNWTEEQIAGIQWTDTMTNDGVYNNYVQVNAILNNAGCKIVYPNEGEKVIIGGAEIQFWNVDHTSYLNQYIDHTMYDYNPCSLCNYLTLGDERICFTGDSSEEVLEKYKTTALPSKIFKVNHHSIGYNMVPLFMNCIMPEVSVSMLGPSTARGRLASNPNQLWHEANHVPHINTGINDHSLSLHLTEHGYKWNTSCRRCIIADEGLT